MFNFNNIDYSSTWYEPALGQFKEELSLPRRQDTSKRFGAAAYKHTTCHGRVKLDPVVFQSGSGAILTDVDNNRYLDLGSGIYVTNLGHSHPKISEAIAQQAKSLTCCHDYLTPVKAAYLEKLANTVSGGLNNIHLYDNGTTAVEFGIKAIRAITGKNEIISCFSDHHGKTAGSAALGRMSPVHGPARLPGFYLVPRPDPYRPIWTKNDGSIDTDAYIDFYDLFIKETTTGQVAAFILEPIQGWGGSIIPPDDFFPKLAAYCADKEILLMTDEILTGCARTGKMLCTEHWDVQPDITVLGKGLGNGFPMSGLLVKDEFAWAMDKIAPSTTFGGNPLACAAGLATLEVAEQENIMEKAQTSGFLFLELLHDLQNNHPIIGDVRGKGCLLGIEFVKDRSTKLPLSEASGLVYQECMKRKLIPGIPVIHLLRLAPPLFLPDEYIRLSIDILDECIGIVEKKLGF